MDSKSEKPSTNYRLLLMEHYDSVVREIDIFVEDLLMRQAQNPDEYSFDAELLNERRMRVIERIGELENETRKYLLDNQGDFDKTLHLDENEMKKRLFVDNYCFVVIKRNNKTKLNEKLILVIDSYIEQKYIDYLKYYFFSN